VNLRQAFGAVFWSFLGVRKGAHYDEDARNLKPHQVIIVGSAYRLVGLAVASSPIENGSPGCRSPETIEPFISRTIRSTSG